MFSPSSLLHSLPRHPPPFNFRQLSDAAGKQRISLSLYRQLLRWCKETDESLPLYTDVKPVNLKAPHIEENRLLSLSDEEKSKFPVGSIIESTQITCPIRNSADFRKFFRAVFRLNREAPSDADTEKARITLAFEAIKSLNKLTVGQLHWRTQNRAHQTLRDGVEFRVGHVVKHKLEDWRGVVIGWFRIPNEWLKHGQDAVETRYTILLDSGDAQFHASKRIKTIDNSILSEEFQSNLQLVEDEILRRIRNPFSVQFFEHFNPVTGMFVPNEKLAYQYPADVESISVERQRASLSSAVQIISGVDDMGDHLRRIILKYTSTPESRKLSILANYLDLVLMEATDDDLSIKERCAAGGALQIKKAAQYLDHLHRLSTFVRGLLYPRRRYMESASSFKFSVGDVVKHKKYGFRGVIVDSDPEPIVDVSGWDGLQHIKNPEMYPFYHIIPEQMDSIDSVGAEGLSRYVCQANLEICPMNERNINVEVEPGWMYNSTEGLFMPPDDVKFTYGMDLGDNGLTMQCLMELRDSLSRTFVAMRDGVQTGNDELDGVTKKLSVENLMDVLGDAEDLETSTAISDSLKMIWMAHMNGDLENQMDTAIIALKGGKIKRALALSKDLVDKDPNYAEAWCTVANCELKLGNFDASLAASYRTLEIMPTHIQAHNGLGLIYHEKKALASAVDSFRKTLELNPWSSVSTRLAVCIDSLEKREKVTGSKNNVVFEHDTQCSTTRA